MKGRKQVRFLSIIQSNAYLKISYLFQFDMVFQFYSSYQYLYKFQQLQLNNQMDSTRTFKIRKTGAKLRTTQQIQDQELVATLQDLRLAENVDQQQSNAKNQQMRVLFPQPYQNDEENINCYRFPHSTFCGCLSNCLLQSFQPIQVIPGLYFGNFVTGLKAKHLLDIGITHVLNATCKQYTKRQYYFKYLNIDLKNTTEEDAKKFFRQSNRFIKDALQQGGKIFIHCSVLQIGTVIVSAYLIGIQKISLKQSLNKLAHTKVEISPHFLKQLQAYDLEKMAFVSIQRQ